ncbi:hypothetical protein CRG98_005422 [Punica granatum]|uniref:Uncharacterized protein n=1 Tax=Punica granatum TaxID=22663 RepID=A0A2I0L0D5_PUNGR|nr:hypothetical protein CRG98_005422 [Punica granatum]
MAGGRLAYPRGLRLARSCLKSIMKPTEFEAPKKPKVALVDSKLVGTAAIEVLTGLDVISIATQPAKPVARMVVVVALAAQEVRRPSRRILRGRLLITIMGILNPDFLRILVVASQYEHISLHCGFYRVCQKLFRSDSHKHLSGFHMTV